MKNSHRLDIDRAILHGCLGAMAGAAFITLFLVFDVFSLGFELDQILGSSVHAYAILYKPMMLCGVAAIGWSVWRQLREQASQSVSRAKATPSSGPYGSSRN